MSLYFEDICAVQSYRAVEEDEDDTDDNIFIDNFRLYYVVTYM